MKVLVTGGGGQLASMLVRVGNDAGQNVIAFSRADLDITQPNHVSRALDAEQFDVVINAAAYTQVDKAENERERAFEVNATGAGLVAKYCNDRGIPVIHISTDYVFDGLSEAPYKETDTTRPLSIYGASKLAGEQAVLTAAARAIIIRTSWVFGADGANFLNTVLRLARERPRLSIVADQISGPTPVDALAAALLRAAQMSLATDFDAWGLYHFQGQPMTSWHDFAVEIVARAHSAGIIPALIPIDTTTTAAFGAPAARPANSQLDCGKWLGVFKGELPDWRMGIDRALHSITTRRH